MDNPTIATLQHLSREDWRQRYKDSYILYNGEIKYVYDITNLVPLTFSVIGRNDEKPKKELLPGAELAQVGLARWLPQESVKYVAHPSYYREGVPIIHGISSSTYSGKARRVIMHPGLSKADFFFRWAVNEYRFSAFNNAFNEHQATAFVGNLTRMIRSLQTRYPGEGYKEDMAFIIVGCFKRALTMEHWSQELYGYTMFSNIPDGNRGIWTNFCDQLKKELDAILLRIAAPPLNEFFEQYQATEVVDMTVQFNWTGVNMSTLFGEALKFSTAFPINLDAAIEREGRWAGVRLPHRAEPVQVLGKELIIDLTNLVFKRPESRWFMSKTGNPCFVHHRSIKQFKRGLTITASPLTFLHKHQLLAPTKTLTAMDGYEGAYKAADVVSVREDYKALARKLKDTEHGILLSKYFLLTKQKLLYKDNTIGYVRKDSIALDQKRMLFSQELHELIGNLTIERLEDAIRPDYI